MQTPKYRYRLSSTGYSSKRYGNCEVCGKYVSEVFYQAEERAFTRPDGTQGWTQQKCVSKFGHKECLLKLRRNRRQEGNQAQLTIGGLEEKWV